MPDDDGDKMLSHASHVRSRKASAACGYNSRKVCQENPTFSNDPSSSDRDGDKPPRPIHVKRSQSLTSYNYKRGKGRGGKEDKLQLLARQVRPDQTLVKNYSSNTQDPWYQNPPGTNIQITTNHFLYM